MADMSRPMNGATNGPLNVPAPIEVRALRKVFRQTMSGQAVVAIAGLDLDIAPR